MIATYMWKMIATYMWKLLSRLKWAFYDALFFFRVGRLYPNPGYKVDLLTGDVYSVLLNKKSFILLGNDNGIVIVYFIVQGWKQYLCHEVLDTYAERVSIGCNVSTYTPKKICGHCGALLLYEHMQHAITILRQLGDDHVYNKLLELCDQLLLIMYRLLERHVLTIQRCWKRCIACPIYEVCRKRLLSEHVFLCNALATL
jgi:hypothetical protein